MLASGRSSSEIAQSPGVDRNTGRQAGGWLVIFISYFAVIFANT